MTSQFHLASGFMASERATQTLILNTKVSASGRSGGGRSVIRLNSNHGINIQTQWACRKHSVNQTK